VQIANGFDLKEHAGTVSRERFIIGRLEKERSGWAQKATAKSDPSAVKRETEKGQGATSKRLLGCCGEELAVGCT